MRAYVLFMVTGVCGLNMQSFDKNLNGVDDESCLVNSHFYDPKLPKSL